LQAVSLTSVLAALRQRLGAALAEVKIAAALRAAQDQVLIAAVEVAVEVL
jgi:hypothetical protein